MGEIISSGALSRYDMSNQTFRQMQRDYIRFTETYSNKFNNAFICTILVNYLSYAQEEFRDDFQNKIRKHLSDTPNSEYTIENRVTFTKKLVEKLDTFDFTNDDNFKKRPVLTYILESFAKMRLSDREKVYCYPQYKMIKKAYDKKIVLLIELSSGKQFEVKPSSIDIDDNSGSYYLIGYSRSKGSNEEFSCHSSKLSRIKKCTLKYEESELTGKQKSTINTILEKFGPAYMQKNLSKSEIEKTVVRLTWKGFHLLYLKWISHQRPVPISEPKCISIDGKEFYELTFDCSYNQIRNYFFSFGADAEIISPSTLREWFFRDYQNALSTYQSDSQ